MDVGFEIRPGQEGGTLQRNVLYEEGLAHLQSGRWQEAIGCLEPLVQAYPNHELFQRALNEARFRARLDATARVRPKRWVLPSWRGIALRALVMLIIAAIAVQGTLILRRYLAPALAEAQVVRQQRQLLAEANARLAAGDLDAASDSYNMLLAEVPDHEEAKQGLEQVEEQRRILNLYEQGVALQEEGDYQAALELFTELSLLESGYRDVNLRVQAITRRQELDRLFAAAEVDYREGLATDALLKYEQIRELNVSYQGDLIVRRLFDLRMQLGRELMEADPPAAEAVPQALEHFREALALQPRSAEVELEYRLAGLFLEGQARYDEGSWEAAIIPLRAIYDQRPGYLSGRVADLLYGAYISSGDGYRGAGDPGLAYEQYRRAADLLVADVSLARNRMATILPLLTPTSTPTVTPTPTATPTGTLIPTPTPIATWTPIPTSTPTPTPRPLIALRNQIVFTSDDEDNPGYWVMDADGGNRQYLGSSRSLRLQFETLLEQSRLSPDGLRRVYTEQVQGATVAQIYVTQPRDPQFGDLPPKQLTQLSGLSYHPVWSPDGGRIAFVSQEAGSDDIWIINADGTGARNLTPNAWEWDKHPSWSPDSTRIVFWSNRTGIKQIFVMDAGGRNVRNISNTQWDEYDPIWIR